MLQVAPHITVEVAAVPVRLDILAHQKMVMVEMDNHSLGLNIQNVSPLHIFQLYHQNRQIIPTMLVAVVEAVTLHKVLKELVALVVVVMVVLLAVLSLLVVFLEEHRQELIILVLVVVELLPMDPHHKTSSDSLVVRELLLLDMLFNICTQ